MAEADFFETIKNIDLENHISSYGIDFNEKHQGLCPFHNEKTPSFTIYQTENKQTFNCFGCGESGDVVDFEQKYNSLSVHDAIERIKIKYNLDLDIPEKIEKKKTEKKKFNVLEEYPPQLPIENEQIAIEKINDIINTDWFIERHGSVEKIYRYENKDGQLLYCKARTEKSKAVPIYFDGKNWQAKHPFEKNRPLYNLQKLKDSELPIFIVEGEKCAYSDIANFIVITWDGGGNAVKKSDWIPLKGKTGYIIPDNDGPGIKAAREISKITGFDILAPINKELQFLECDFEDLKEIEKVFFIDKKVVKKYIDTPFAVIETSIGGKKNIDYFYCSGFEKTANGEKAIYKICDGYDTADYEKEGGNVSELITDMINNKNLILEVSYEKTARENDSKQATKEKEIKTNEKEHSNNNNDSNRDSGISDRQKNNSQTNELQDSIETDLLEKFKVLGYDQRYYYFLPKGMGVVKSISHEGIGKGFLTTLIPDNDFWQYTFPKTTRGGGIDWESAIVYIKYLSEKAGIYDPNKFRAAGAWRDGENIIINTGRKLIINSPTGKISESSVTDFDSKDIYILSTNGMFDFLSNRKEAPQESCKDLLCHVSDYFKNDYDGMVSLCWAIMANFAGLLKKRPHLWINGQSRSGKSHFIYNFMYSVSGNWKAEANGQSTEAGIRQTLQQSARPLYFDEAEPRNKYARQKIDGLLTLARNAHDDGAANYMLGSQDGTATQYKVTSMFCFGSVVPLQTNSAIESRFIFTEKSVLRDSDKKRLTKERLAISEKFNHDYRNITMFIFNRIHLVLKNMQLIHEFVVLMTGDSRRADLLSPILSCAWVMYYDDIFDKDKLALSDDTDKLYQLFSVIVTDSHDGNSDEKRLLDTILTYHVRVAPDNTMTVESMLNYLHENSSDISYSTKLDAIKKHLINYGIKLYDFDGKETIAIVRDNQHIKDMLRNTEYTGDYKKVLERHEAVISRTHAVRVGSVRSCILLDYGIVFDVSDNEDDAKEDLF